MQDFKQAYTALHLCERSVQLEFSMLLKDTARFWDVRFDVPHKYRVKQPDGSSREYDGKQHKLACVAASTIAEAIALVMAEWPAATIWQANNHGRECNVLVADSVR